MFKKYTEIFLTSNVGDSCGEDRLKQLEIGYFVTYKKEEYEIISQNVYDYSDEEKVLEWELLGFNKSFFLQYFDKNKEWFVNNEIPIRQLGSKFITSLEKNKKADDEISFNSLFYILEDSKIGQIHTQKSSSKKTKYISSLFYSNNFNSSLIVIHTFTYKRIRGNDNEYICYFAQPVFPSHFSNISQF